MGRDRRVETIDDSAAGRVPVTIALMNLAAQTARHADISMGMLREVRVRLCDLVVVRAGMSEFDLRDGLVSHFRKPAPPEAVGAR